MLTSRRRRFRKLFFLFIFYEHDLILNQTICFRFEDAGAGREKEQNRKPRNALHRVLFIKHVNAHVIKESIWKSKRLTADDTTRAINFQESSDGSSSSPFDFKSNPTFDIERENVCQVVSCHAIDSEWVGAR